MVGSGPGGGAEAGSFATCYGGAVRSYFQTGGWGGEAGKYEPLVAYHAF